MTDAQFEKIKKGLIFYSENGIDNLCTLTETALRELLDEVSKGKVVEHFEAYGQCRDSRRIAELEAENQKWKDEWQEQVQKATDEGYARTLQTMQLNKAKQFIRDFLAVAIDYIDKEDKNYSLIEEGQQLLREVEK